MWTSNVLVPEPICSQCQETGGTAAHGEARPDRSHLELKVVLTPSLAGASRKAIRLGSQL